MEQFIVFGASLFVAFMQPLGLDAELVSAVDSFYVFSKMYNVNLWLTCERAGMA